MNDNERIQMIRARLRNPYTWYFWIEDAEFLSFQLEQRDKTTTHQEAEIARLQNLGGDLVVDKADLKMKNRLMLSALERIIRYATDEVTTRGRLLYAIDKIARDTIAQVNGGVSE